MSYPLPMDQPENDLDRLLAYYKPRVRERADKLRAAGERISHHTAWFPLVDAYENSDGEQPLGRGLHKKAALQVFKEWCTETGVEPESAAGEFGHNFLVLVKQLSMFGTLLALLGATVNAIKLEVQGFALLIMVAIVLGLVWAVSWWLHRKYLRRVFRNQESADGSNPYEDKMF